MNRIKLSVIIPCYNSERFIADVLKDICILDRDDIEVIVVNDGSIDRTKEIVTRLMEKDKRLVLIDEKNEGVSAARNKGITKSKGKYVYFIDSDDRLLPGSMQYMMQLIDADDEKNDMMFLGYESVAKGNVVDYSWPKYNHQYMDGKKVNELYLSKKICFHINSIIFRKGFLSDNTLEFSKGITIGEDIEFILKSLAMCKNAVYYARKCFSYQIRDDSTMNGYNTYSKKQFKSFLLNCKTISKLKKTNGELSLYYNYFRANSYLSNLVYYLKSDYKDKTINRLFEDYKKVLTCRMPVGNLKRFAMIKVARLFPINGIFWRLMRKS